MTDSVVFESSRAGNANIYGVFDTSRLVATGTQYPIEVPTIAQSPTVVATWVVQRITYSKQFSFIQRPELAKGIGRAKSFTVAEHPTLEIWQATTLGGIGEVSQDPTIVVRDTGQERRTIAQDPTVAVTWVVTPNATHTTYYWPEGFVGAGGFTQDPTLYVNRGSQNIKSLEQRPTLQYVISVISGGVSTTPLGYALTQQPQLGVTLQADIKAVAHQGGAMPSWLLEPRPEARAPRVETQADRERRRREESAAAFAAAEAERKAKIAASAQRMAELEQGMAAQSAFNAPFRLAYEKQFGELTQQMSAQGQAAMAEIARLRSALAATQAQLQEEERQDNEDAAIALLLLKQ